MTQNRRTLLRHAVGLGGGSILLGIAGCLDNGPDLDPPGSDGGTGSSEDALALHSGLEIGMLFTGPGGLPAGSEVNPDEPEGGRLVTLSHTDPGEQVTFDWRETVEREITPTATTDVGVGTETPTPETELVERTGTINAGGLDDAREPLLPMFWESGEKTTETSAMWLSREAFRELRDTRQTVWSEDPLTRISWVGKEVQERIHSGVEEVDEVYLEAEADFVDFELLANNQSIIVEAIKAHDSFGNEYVIVAKEGNPLVVKFTYNAVSVGFTGFDTAVWTLIKAVYSGYQVMSTGPA